MDRSAFMSITELPLSQANLWYPFVNKAMRVNRIIEKKEKAMFMAVIMAESNAFRSTVDNMEYSIDELKREFQGSLSHYQAEMLGGTVYQEPKREAIANLVYARRNGNIGVHDGWKYRPRGLIPVVGVDNYARIGRIFNMDFVKEPELIEKPDVAAMTAGHIWRSSGAAELDSMVALCQLFNGRTSSKLAAYNFYLSNACKGLSVRR